jgi:hypothetical protein
MQSDAQDRSLATGGSMTKLSEHRFAALAMCLGSGTVGLCVGGTVADWDKAADWFGALGTWATIGAAAYFGIKQLRPLVLQSRIEHERHLKERRLRLQVFMTNFEQRRLAIDESFKDFRRFHSADIFSMMFDEIVLVSRSPSSWIQHAFKRPIAPIDELLAFIGAPELDFVDLRSADRVLFDLKTQLVAVRDELASLSQWARFDPPNHVTVRSQKDAEEWHSKTRANESWLKAETFIESGLADIDDLSSDLRNVIDEAIAEVNRSAT